MISLRKINPMARAVGTMGVVAALVGAVTYADLSTTAVALAPNDITTGTASLVISAGAANTVAGTCSSPGSVTPGITDTALVPGGTTPTVTFCLGNTGDVPLDIAASIPQNLSGSVAAQNTTLTVSCPTLGGDLVGTLSAWGPAAFSGGSSLDPGNAVTCTASASLSSSYSGQGGETIPTFQVNFVGNQTTSTNT